MSDSGDAMDAEPAIEMASESVAHLLARLRRAAGDAEEARRTGDLMAQAQAQAKVRQIADALLRPTLA